MPVSQVLPPPPRFTGDSQVDFLTLVQWIHAFYQATIQNLQQSGTFTISETDTTVDVEVDAQVDAGYTITPAPDSYTGSPILDAFVMKSITKRVDGFTAEINGAPGVGAAVTFAWVLSR